MYSSKPVRRDTMVLAQIIKEEIKREIMEELWTRQQRNFTPENFYHGEMEVTGGESGETAQLNITGDQPGNINNPYARSVEKNLLDEPDTAFYTERGTISQWVNDATEDRGKEILYGIGTVALLGMLMPSFGRKIQIVLTRAALEGVELIGKARSVVARAKEDIEDLMAEANLKDLMKPRK